jgi:hypothetical protein
VLEHRKHSFDCTEAGQQTSGQERANARHRGVALRVDGDRELNVEIEPFGTEPARQLGKISDDNRVSACVLEQGTKPLCPVSRPTQQPGGRHCRSSSAFARIGAPPFW